MYTGKLSKHWSMMAGTELSHTDGENRLDVAASATGDLSEKFNRPARLMIGVQETIQLTGPARNIGTAFVELDTHLAKEGFGSRFSAIGRAYVNTDAEHGGSLGVLYNLKAQGVDIGRVGPELRYDNGNTSIGFNFSKPF
jgi:hypothetical protein